MILRVGVVLYVVALCVQARERANVRDRLRRRDLLLRVAPKGKRLSVVVW
jgi:hypothetical protein